MASLIAQLVKNPSAMWEIWVHPLGWEVHLKKGKATHSSILVWRIPWICKESDTTEQLSLYTLNQIHFTNSLDFEVCSQCSETSCLHRHGLPGAVSKGHYV